MPVSASGGGGSTGGSSGGTTSGGSSGGTTGQSPSTCSQVRACLSLCGQNNSSSCTQQIQQQSDRTALRHYQSLTQCAQQNCAQASNQGQCIQQNCSQEYQTCYGEPSGSNYTCSGYLRCRDASGISECLDNKCSNVSGQQQTRQCAQNRCSQEWQAYQSCQNNISRQGAQRYQTMVQCYENNNCGSAQDSTSCLRNNCESEYKSCYHCP